MSSPSSYEITWNESRSWLLSSLPLSHQAGEDRLKKEMNGWGPCYMECNSHRGKQLSKIHPCGGIYKPNSMLVKITWLIFIHHVQVLLGTIWAKPICLNFTARIV